MVVVFFFSSLWCVVDCATDVGIISVDLDLRKTLFANCVLSGGSTLFRPMGERILAEVKRVAPVNTHICISAPRERKYSTWIGGSILASLDTFKNVRVHLQFSSLSYTSYILLSISCLFRCGSPRQNMQKRETMRSTERPSKPQPLTHTHTHTPTCQQTNIT